MKKYHVKVPKFIPNQRNNRPYETGFTDLYLKEKEQDRKNQQKLALRKK